jgi:hypothetical protein
LGHGGKFVKSYFAPPHQRLREKVGGVAVFRANRGSRFANEFLPFPLFECLRYLMAFRGRRFRHFL